MAQSGFAPAKRGITVSTRTACLSHQITQGQRRTGAAPTEMRDMHSFLLNETGTTWDAPDLRGGRIAVYAALADCESLWRAGTAAGACTVFQTYEWLAVWRETIGVSEGAVERIVQVAAGNGQTLMLLPLAIHRHPWGRSLQFLGGGLTDYNAAVVEPDFAARLTANDLARLWAAILGHLPAVDVVWLKRMPARVDGVPNPLAALQVRHAIDAFAARLPATFDAFAKARSTQFFSQNRRYRRRLEKIGPVRVVTARATRERIEIVRFLIAHKARWQRAGGVSENFSRPDYTAFYEQVTARTFPEGEIDVSGLYVGDDLVAGLWGAVFRGRYAFLVTSYSADWSRLSVGRLLMESVIARCIERGDLALFDLTVGEESYKANWADHSTSLYEHLSPRSIRGRLFVAWWRGRERLKTLPLARRLAGVLSFLRGRARPDPVPTEGDAAAPPR